MEQLSLHYLVYAKEKRQYILRNRHGKGYKLCKQLDLQKIDFFGRTKHTLYIKSGHVLYHVDIGEGDRQLKKEAVDDNIFCVHRGMLFNYDGQVLSYLLDDAWENITLEQSLNDVSLLYSSSFGLMAFGTNIHESPRILQMALRKNKTNAAKKIKRSGSFESSQNSNDDSEADSEDDDKYWNVTCNGFKIEKIEKIIAFQSFKEEDGGNYLYYICSSRKEKKKVYEVMRAPGTKIKVAEPPASLLGFIGFSNNLYLYGTDRGGSLVFHRYNFRNRFEPVSLQDFPNFFKKNETDKLFPIILSRKELEIITRETFHEVKMPKSFSSQEAKNLIVLGKRNADKPRPNYYESDLESSASVEYSDSDQVEYLSSSSSDEETETEQDTCSSCETE